MPDKSDVYYEVRLGRARFDKAHKSGGASDGGVAQLVRAAES